MITKVEAFTFLEQHQPMPDDSLVKSDEIKKYEEVRLFFLNNPDERCIPLFLNSFGGKDGFGVYQMVEDVMRQYDKNKVVPHLLDSLKSKYSSVKYWSIQISALFPDIKLFNPLVKLLEDTDEDIVMETIIALAQLALNGINYEEVIQVLRDEVKKPFGNEIRELTEEILLDIQKHN